jgi:hypothetical protein
MQGKEEKKLSEANYARAHIIGMEIPGLITGASLSSVLRVPARNEDRYL